MNPDSEKILEIFAKAIESGTATPLEALKTAYALGMFDKNVDLMEEALGT